jgi:hypothetical protein
MTMEKVSFEIYATEAIVKPDNYNKLRVEVVGVEISNLVEAVDENADILKEIGVENIAEWIIEESSLFQFLDYFDDVAIMDYLKSKGWEMGNDSDD